MSAGMPRTELLLINERNPGVERQPDIDELLRSLRNLPGFDDVTLTPKTRSTVTASVPARNMRERDRLKALVNERVDGWHVLEEQAYQLPRTF